MVKRRNEKIRSAVTLEAKVTDVLVVENGALQPYIKIFHYLPENVAHESLGMLLGVFEIGDRSESSAYIVNFLASVAKKEYFSQPKRGVPESLEATLHKINRALAEVVKQGNTEWLGTLQGAVCAVNQGTLHFSVTGDGHVILIRNEFLSIVSEGLSPEDAALHPLKTFAEISSGRLQDGDTVIISTPEIFDVLTPADIERASKHFPRERLSQFLRTAMVNQLPLGGAFVVSTETVSVAPKTRIVEQEPSPEKHISNVFSQSTFHNRPQRDVPSQSDGHKEPSTATYTDTQTGHIYIQGEASEGQTPRNERMEHWQMRLDDLSFALRRLGKSIGYRIRSVAFSIQESLRAGITSGVSLARHSTHQMMKHRTAKSAANTLPLPTEEPTVHDGSLLPPPFKTAETRPEVRPQRSLREPEERITEPAPRPSIVNSTEEPGWKVVLINISRSTLRVLVPLSRQIGVLLRKTTLLLRQWLGQGSRILWNWVVRLSRFLWQWYHSLDRRKQYITLGILAACVFSLGWYVSHRPAPTPPRATTPIRQPSPPPPVVTENHLETAQPTTLSSQSGVVGVFVLDTAVIAATPSTVIMIQNGAQLSYPLPPGSGNAREAALIGSLRTVFILTDSGKLLSFTAANHAFTENTITVGNAKDIVGLSGYLSYLYALNPSKNEILRYPRAEGGFGAPVSWLKEALPLGGATSIATDSRLLITAGNRLLALSRGKTDTTVTFENSNTPIAYTAVTVHPDTGAVYVLDASYGRIIAYDENGKIEKQYASPQMKQATSLALDTAGKFVIFSTPTGIYSIPAAF